MTSSFSPVEVPCTLDTSVEMILAYLNKRVEALDMSAQLFAMMGRLENEQQQRAIASALRNEMSAIRRGDWRPKTKGWSK